MQELGTNIRIREGGDGVCEGGKEVKETFPLSTPVNARAHCDFVTARVQSIQVALKGGCRLLAHQSLKLLVCISMMNL